MKALIFDSGPLINFSINGFLPVLERLRENFNGKFLITADVKREVYDRPLTIQKFELDALRIKDLLDRKILETPESLGISTQTVKTEMEYLLEKANHLVFVHGHPVHIVSEAEISCLALSRQLSKIGVESLIAVDERTARMLCEKPENLANVMSKKLHMRVDLELKSMKDFQGFKFVRSPELIYVAYKKGLTKLKDPKALEAFLYATKYKGAAISFEEISALKKL